jgi:uncharacterized protein YraI
MKRLALSCCALMLFASAAAAKPGTAASTVNLRAEASTSSAILAKIPAGSRIDVGDCSGEWCAVSFQGRSGFAIATALDTTGRVVRRPAPVRRGPPAGYAPAPYDDDDDYVPVAPRPLYGPPAVVVAPGPYYGYGYGYGPYWGGPGWGYRRWGGWRRW